MNAKLSADKKTLIIELAVVETPRPSGSGKTLILATTGGNQAVQVGNQIVKIGVNAFIPNPQYKAPAK